MTNDFPPRIGGIESFVALACQFLDDDVAVLTSTAPGAAAWDAHLRFTVVRLPGPLLPTRSVGRAAIDLMRASGADRVLFGAAAPLGLLASSLRRAGAERIVALTHGHETWWASVPGARRLLRRIGDEVDVLTTISDYVTSRLAPALSDAGRAKMIRLPPPVDTGVFRPSESPAGSFVPVSTADVETGTKAGVVAVGRMVRRKGFDTLITAWSMLALSGCQLVLVGDGPQRRRLERQVGRLGLHDVVFTGPLDQIGVRTRLRQAAVFALPVRTGLGGLDAEGLGLAGLEAAACGLPVVIGRSGGAPETVRHGRTGYVVDSDDPYELAARLRDLLVDPHRAAAMGRAGRSFVGEHFDADRARRTLRAALGTPPAARV
ncbi:MAG: glycosyltransferase family 4 protein [Microlunatus sp.]|nr:glycosyltransferase family 4 protein [Microlunatus sp.]